MSELITAKKFIYDSLSKNTTVKGLVGTRIYDTVAPLDASFPLVLFQVQEPQDVQVANGKILFSRFRFLVRGVNKTGSVSGLETLSDAMESALNFPQGIAFNGSQIISYREDPFEMLEVENGAKIWYLGFFLTMLISEVN